MTNQRTMRRTSVIVAAILLITMSLLCVTLAKYTTEVTGSYDAPVATWNFTANNETETFTFNLGLAEGEKLAPGTSGSFTIALANASDVKADYTVEATADNAPKALTITVTENASGTLDKTGTATATVTWNWEFDASENDDNDWFSTAADAKTVTVNVTVTGTQHDESATD